MTHSVYFITAVVIMAVLHLVNGMYDGRYINDNTGDNFYQNVRPLIDESYLRSSRNAYQSGRQPQNEGPRFGWQNPIRVAPTLPTRENYPQEPPYLTTPRYDGYPSPLPHPEYPTTQRYNYPTTSRYDDLTTRRYNNPTTSRGQYRPETMPTFLPQTGSGVCSSGQKRDKVSRNCVKLGSFCGENMAFYEDPSENGFAQCDCIQHANRPLIYHSNTRKCYFAFQQAYCSQSQWLVVDPLLNKLPRCDVNRCRQWISDTKSIEWDWTNNRPELDKNGPIAVLNERKCTILGSACTREGRDQLMKIIAQERNTNTGISLAFEGTSLVCRRGQASGSSEFDSNRNGASNSKLTLICKPGLFNKWSLDGNCGN